MELLPILAKALDDYRRNPRLIVPHLVKYVITIALVVLLALGFVLSMGAYFLTPGGMEGLLLGQEIPFGAIFFLIFGLLAFVILYSLLDAAARGAVIAMAREAHLTGATSLSTGLSGARRFWLPIFGYNLFLTVVALGLGALFLVPLLMSAAMGGGYGIAVTFLLLAVTLMVALYAVTFFAPQFLVIEEAGLLDGIKTAAAFFRRRYAQVLGYGAAAALVYTALLLALLTAVAILGLDEGSAQVFQYVYWALVDLVSVPYFEMVKTYMALGEATSPSGASSPPPPPGG